jgi:hypothetical protein
LSGNNLTLDSRLVWSVNKKALAVEAPRFGKGSGAKEDPLQPANFINLSYHIIVENFQKKVKKMRNNDFFYCSVPLSLSKIIS